MKIKNTKIEVIKGDITNLPIDVVVNDAEAPSTSDQEKVRAAYANGLNGSEGSAATSVAFPGIGVKSGFPAIGSAKICTQEILKFFKTHETTTVTKIVICLDDDEVFRVFKREVPGYTNHLQKTLGGEPYQTVDIIIELKEGLILIERSYPPYGWALPGGFVDPGEDLQTAAVREAKEETNMDLEDIRKLKMYDEPGRDPRFETHSTVFIARGVGTPQFGDDAKNLKIVNYDDLLNLEYAFDHHTIIGDYLGQKREK